jgi:methionyl-tRNA formyltransferase
LAVAPLRAVVEAGFDVPLVVSGADARRGRGGSRGASPVKAAAVELGIGLTDRVEDVLEVDADLGVVVAFGKLIRLPVLEMLPMVNIHFSKLPRWRGAAPVERAILAGDTTTAVALMAVEEGLDTGPVFATSEVEIDPDETLSELRDQLVGIGSQMLVTSLREGFATPVPQAGEATYAAKLSRDELEIDWHRSADEVHRLVRLERAWTMFRGDRFKVGRVRRPDGDQSRLEPGEVRGTLVGTGTVPLELVDVQPAGKARQLATAWSNGARLASGERLG